MSLSFWPDVNSVLTPAFWRHLLSWKEMPPCMKGMRAKGLNSSSFKSESLKGKTSKRLSGMISVWLCLVFFVDLFFVPFWFFVCIVGGV